MKLVNYTNERNVKLYIKVKEKLNEISLKEEDYC